MSAWMFGYDGMDRVLAAIEYAAKNGAAVPMASLLTPDTGQRLLRMNSKAIEERYGEEGMSEREIKRYKRTKVQISEVQMCKTLRCFTYQCSEGGVPEMQLFKDIRGIEDWFNNRIGYDQMQHNKSLREAYDAAEWG